VVHWGSGRLTKGRTDQSSSIVIKRLFMTHRFSQSDIFQIV
jgi:hypothetical protein